MSLQQNTPATESDVFNEIRNIQTEILNLMDLKNKGMVESVDVVIHELAKKEFSLKEKKVLEVHSYAITQTSIMKNGKSVPKWQTNCGDKRPRCSTYEALIDKLYEHYFGKTAITDYSFKAIFELAVQEKIDTERPKEKTIRDYYSSYKAFITDELGAKDIRLIKATELKKYIMDTVINLNLTEKRLLKLKGILNLVFNYATYPEHRILEFSPVPPSNRQFKRYSRPVKTKPEEKAFQPTELELIRKHLWERVHSREYDINGYAILFASEVGLREGEIPSLKWCDITDTAIHIHSQQNDERRDGKKVFYYNPTTKNEKGICRDGRYFPMHKKVKEILDEVKAKQETLGIETEWVFARRDGSWTTTVAYSEALNKVAHKLGLSLSNNHAFRIALNSYVLVPMGIPVTERAQMLGHSVDTNLRHYTFARTDEYLSEITNKWNDFIDETREVEKKKEVPRGTSNVVPFQAKEKSLESSKTQASF